MGQRAILDKIMAKMEKSISTKNERQRRAAMSEWITDRRPTIVDSDMAGFVWVTTEYGTVLTQHWAHVYDRPWMPIPKIVPPEPYVKPKRWVAVYDRNYKCWAVGDRAHVTKLARLALYSVCRCSLGDRAGFTHLVHLVEDTDQHREAAERIAAIYEEYMS